MFVDSIPEGRVKPWGTGHAVLCAADKESVMESFRALYAAGEYGLDLYGDLDV